MSSSTQPTKEQSKATTVELAKRFYGLYLEPDFSKFKTEGANIMYEGYKLGFDNGTIKGEDMVMIKLREIINNSDKGSGSPPDFEKLLEGFHNLIRDYRIRRTGQ